MNWLKKTIGFGEKIKKILKKRPSREEIESSEWTSCCKGPVLKKGKKRIKGSEKKNWTKLWSNDCQRKDK